MKDLVKIDQIEIIPEIQVRFSLYPARVEFLKGLITDGQVDPILVSRNVSHFVLIDGFHRLEAAKQLGLKEIEAKIEEIPETEWFTRAYTANAKHGQPLTREEKEEFIATLARQGRKTEEIAKVAMLSQRRIQQILAERNVSLPCNKAKIQSKDRIVICKRWLSEENQEDIAKDFNVSQQAISEACSQLINEITGRYKSGKHKWEIADEYGLTEIETDNILAKSGDPLNFDLPENTWWPSFGLDKNQPKYPGATPLNLVKSILAYFTKPSNHIVDLMAGSGTLGLACRDMVDRTYELFDLNPIENPLAPISYHNLNNKGEPILPSCQKPDFVFLDPPYSRVAKDKYPQNAADLSLLEPKAFIHFMQKLFLEIRESWSPCIVAILMSNLREKGYIYDLPSQVSASLELSNAYRLLDHIVNQYGWTESCGLPWPTKARQGRWLLRNHIHIIVGETNG